MIMYQQLCKMKELCSEIEAETVNRECSDYKVFCVIGRSIEALLTEMEDR